MPLKLPPLQTVTQCASLVTATRAVWELSRMVRAKKREMDQTKEVEDLLDEIEDFVREGVLTKREWKAFCHQVEEAMQKKDCTPREAQAKVLDFLEALHSIAQEFDEDEADDVYLSEPEEVGDHRYRIERKARHHPRRDSAVNSPSPRLPRSQTVPPFDPHPRRASAPLAPQHYHAYSPAAHPSPGIATPPLPNQSYRPPGNSFASPSTTPGASRVVSPPRGNGVFSPGHMLPNQPTYYPTAPQSSTPSTASPFAASPNPSAFHTAGSVSPPHSNYSGPLPVPPSRPSSQQSWGLVTTQVPVGPTSLASTIPDQNGWAPNASFPFHPGNQSNGNSSRPSAAPSPLQFRSSPAHNVSTTPPGNTSPATASSNAGFFPMVSPSLSGSTIASASGCDGHIGSPSGFTSPSQEAQAQRAAAARLRDQARRHSQAQAIAEEQGVPDFDVPPPPNVLGHQQQNQFVNWANGSYDSPKEEDVHGGYQPAGSVSEVGTYMDPAGAKNKRRRRKQ